jgi:hypothetical protein
MDTKHEALDVAFHIEHGAPYDEAQIVALLRRQHARIEELERALGQASFCIRELLPGNKDGEYTLSIINRALLTKKD